MESIIYFGMRDNQTTTNLGGVTATAGFRRKCNLYKTFF